MFRKQRSLSLHDYKNPKTLKKKVFTISLKLILSTIVGAFFWLKLLRVFGRYHTGTLCKVFFCVGQVWCRVCWNRMAHWWFFRHHQLPLVIGCFNINKTTYSLAHYHFHFIAQNAALCFLSFVFGLFLFFIKSSPNSQVWILSQV